MLFCLLQLLGGVEQVELEQVLLPLEVETLVGGEHAGHQVAQD